MKKCKHMTLIPINRAFYSAPLFISMMATSCYSVAQSTEEPNGPSSPSISSDTDNRDFVRTAIISICPPNDGRLGAELQTRCNAVAGIGLPNDIMTQVTSEQTAAQKSMSIEMNGNQLGILSNRISAIRTGRQGGGLNVSGLMLDNNNNPIAMNQSFSQLGAGAGDTHGGYERLGIFANANIGFGDRRTTSNETGYDLDTHGGTVGIDYRISDNFLLGTAFAYNNATSGYANNLGEMEADNYTGAIYGSFFTEDGFFIDGIFSGSSIDYATRRRIQYTAGTDVVNTNALGDNSGTEFNVSMNSGYNFNYSGLTITPQVRVDYTSSGVDALNETGGSGWALHVDEQDFDSMQTAAGLQLNYAISLPWAIIVPMVQAEYIHEFKNDQRNIRAFYIQDSTQTRFNIMTDKPDRDYIVMSAGISAQFMHGISAFVNYDTVQAHTYVNNHNFAGGVRVQLPF